MGGLRKYMPITWITSLLGSLALIGTPFFSGFYSKDMIIEAVKASTLPAAGFAYFAVLAGVFVTAFYSFRMYFLVFHGKERFNTDAHAAGHGHAAGHDDRHGHGHDGGHGGGLPHESPAVITLPLVLLAIPSVLIGMFTIGPMLFSDFFQTSISVFEPHNAMEVLAKEFHGPAGMAVHALTTLPFWLALAGVASAYYCYMVNPAVPAWFGKRFSPVYRLLDNKFYLDRFNEVFFAGGARSVGSGLWKFGDQAVIDGVVVNGSARVVGWLAGALRGLQSGFLYHYAIAMIVGVALFVWWFVPLLRR